MYAAEIDGKPYTFEASGSLWKDALVMMDRQTSSLWSQIMGEALDGPMVGAKLELYPSEFMDFSAVLEKYPNAQFLKKDSKGDKGSYYKRYFDDPERIGIFGHTFESKDEGLGTKDHALGLRLGRDAVALPIKNVTKPSAAKVDLMDKAVVVFYNPATKDASAYATSVENANKKKLNVEIDGSVTFEGKKLSADDFRKGIKGFEPMPVMTTFWFAWKDFFPRTEIGRFYPGS